MRADRFHDTLKDVYFAEKKILTTLPKMAAVAANGHRGCESLHLFENRPIVDVFEDLAKVYQKLVKYEPNSVSAWLNIGEAYMSFNPPKTTEALPYYRKAYELDSHSTMAALRMGEIMARLNAGRQRVAEGALLLSHARRRQLIW